MDYSNLLNKAWALSWKYKILWVLGFFAAAMGYAGGAENVLIQKSDSFNFNFDNGILEGIGDWFQYNPEVSIALVIFFVGMVMLLLLIIFILNLISVAGLIQGVYQIERNENIRLSQLFRAGASYFWRFLGLFFIAGIVIFAFVILIIVINVIAFAIAAPLGILSILISIPIGIFGLFFIENLYSLTQREIVTNQAAVFQSIGEAYNLLIKHLGPNFVIFLIQMLIGIAIFIGALIILMIFAAPIIIMAAYSPWILLASLAIIIPLLLLISIFVEGFFGTFTESLMTLFYLELRKLTPRQIIPPSPGPAPMPQA